MNPNRMLPSNTMEALGFADLDGLVTVSWSNAPHPNDSSEAYVARQIWLAVVAAKENQQVYRPVGYTWGHVLPELSDTFDRISSKVENRLVGEYEIVASVSNPRDVIRYEPDAAYVALAIRDVLSVLKLDSEALLHHYVSIHRLVQAFTHDYRTLFKTFSTSMANPDLNPPPHAVMQDTVKRRPDLIPKACTGWAAWKPPRLI